MAYGGNDPHGQTQEPVHQVESNCDASPSSSLPNGAPRAAADDAGDAGLSPGRPSTAPLRTREQAGDRRVSGTGGSGSASKAAPSYSFANGAARDAGDAGMSPGKSSTSPLRTLEQPGERRGSGTGGSGSASKAAPSYSFANGAARAAVAGGLSLRKSSTSPLRTLEQPGERRGSGTGGSSSAASASNAAPSFSNLAPPAAGFDAIFLRTPLTTPQRILEQPGYGRIGTGRPSSAAAADRKVKKIATTSPPPFSPSSSAAAADRKGKKIATTSPPFSSSSSSSCDTASFPSLGKSLKRQTVSCAEGASQPRIRSVWRDNLQQELESVRSLLQRGRMTVALDMEFASAVQDQDCPRTAAHWYKNVSELVNAGDILQLGLAVSPDFGASNDYVIELNMQFDVNSRLYNPNTLKFLKDHHYDLEAHKANGIPPCVLAEWLLSEFDRLCDRRITWVFFQGDYDIAFLLKLLGNSMPDTLVQHLRRYTCSFPVLYDARVLSKLMFGRYAKGLSWLADELSVRRIGNEHSSGSDALLTLHSFFELRRRLGDDTIHAWRGVLCGLFDVDSIVSQSLPMGHCDVQLVHVWLENFDCEASLIGDAVELNHYIVGLDVCISPALRQRIFHTDVQECFEQMFYALRLAGHYEVSLSLVSYSGQFPQRRSWVFHLSEFTNAPHHIHFTKFAELLEDCNLIRNERIIWATFEGAEGIGSLCRIVQRSSMQADLPFRFEEYIRCRHLIFPSLYDVGLLVHWGDGIALADIARGLGLPVPHEQSGWKAVLCAQVMVRLRETLEESNSLLEAYADRCGRLLAKCCSSLRLYR